MNTAVFNSTLIHNYWSKSSELEKQNHTYTHKPYNLEITISNYPGHLNAQTGMYRYLCVYLCVCMCVCISYKHKYRYIKTYVCTYTYNFSLDKSNQFEI